MKFSKFKFLVESDLYRYTGRISLSDFLRAFIIIPGFKYSFWMRTCAYIKQHNLLNPLLFPFVRIILVSNIYRFGISVPYATQIGSGFYIGHFGGIVVNHNSVIGKNCNISHGVTLGRSNRGKRKGAPIIGDNVYLGPGAKIVGAVTIGNNVAIGANCVVTTDIPDDGVVVGIPGEVISYKGSYSYVNNTDYSTPSSLNLN